jgi:phage terminase large subunit GpA-like protein
MSADLLGGAIRCPHCGQEIRLDEAIVNQLTEPLRLQWEQEVRQVEERADTKIAKLETQLVLQL